MSCWNGLSPDQREFLRTKGYLPMGYRPGGDCLKGAQIEITTEWDEFPGPRFYCLRCAVGYLQELTLLGREAVGFTCARCGMVSYHPVDAVERYCGACHDWTRLG